MVGGGVGGDGGYDDDESVDDKKPCNSEICFNPSSLIKHQSVNCSSHLLAHPVADW